MLRVLLLTLLLPLVTLADQVTSEYTSTKAGIVLEQSGKKDEIDFFKWRCKGVGGYKLIFQGFDARSWLDLEYGETFVDLRDTTFKLSPGTFPNKANDVVEWRGVVHGGKFIPYAMIYRLEGGNDQT